MKDEFCSFVHEASDQEVSYDHTHVLLALTSRLDSRNPRIFDFEGQHPNIQTLITQDHRANTWNYHEKDPVFLHPALPRDNPYTRVTPGGEERAIKKARTLFDACKALGIEIKSVGDVNLIRKDKELIEDIPAPFPADSFNRELIADKTVMVFHGPSGLGKSAFACAHTPEDMSFLMVSHIDDLKRFDSERHGLLIFDDMSFAHWPRESCIHLLDSDYPRSINVKHSVVTIPARTNKIFTHNLDGAMDIFPESCRHEVALNRRVHYKLHIVGKLWAEVATPPLMVRQGALTGDDLGLVMGDDPSLFEIWNDGDSPPAWTHDVGCGGVNSCSSSCACDCHVNITD